MNKKRAFIFVLLLSWFSVSAYFYVHHRVVVKTMLIPGWELSEQRTLVQIKEIRLYRKTPINRPFEWYSTGIRNWVLNSKLIPDNLKAPIFATISFYNHRYQSDDAWYLKVKGVYLTKDSDVAEMPDITLKSGGEIIASFDGRETRGSEEGNFRFFTIGGKGVNSEIKELEVTTHWRNKTKVDRFKINFQTESYDFFSEMPSAYDTIDPVKVANKFFWDYAKQRNDEKIKPEFEEKLKWARDHQKASVLNPYAVFLERYKGYDNVLRVRMNYVLSGDNNPTPEKIDRMQDFYLVEKNGVFEVIAIGLCKKA